TLDEEHLARCVTLAPRRRAHRIRRLAQLQRLVAGEQVHRRKRPGFKMRGELVGVEFHGVSSGAVALASASGATGISLAAMTRSMSHTASSRRDATALLISPELASGSSGSSSTWVACVTCWRATSVKPSAVSKRKSITYRISLSRS